MRAPIVENRGTTMADALVFHLKKLGATRVFVDVLRFDFDPRDFDPRYSVEKGDVWQKTAKTGDVTYHRVAQTRTYLTITGEELHVYMTPANFLANA